MTKKSWQAIFPCSLTGFSLLKVNIELPFNSVEHPTCGTRNNSTWTFRNNNKQYKTSLFHNSKPWNRREQKWRTRMRFSYYTMNHTTADKFSLIDDDLTYHRLEVVSSLHHRKNRACRLWNRRKWGHSKTQTFVVIDHGGTRTRNLPLRRRAPYPLGHATK